MNYKIITCIHDKKSDLFDAFIVHNNTNDALRSFEMACQQNETFKKWPEDYQLVLVSRISYENGELNEKGEIQKQSQLTKSELISTVIAEAKDFVKKENAKNTKKN